MLRLRMHHIALQIKELHETHLCLGIPQILIDIRFHVFHIDQLSIYPH